MDVFNPSNCWSDGLAHAQGTQVCGDGGCMVCDSGEWKPQESSTVSTGLGTISPGRDLSDI